MYQDYSGNIQALRSGTPVLEKMAKIPANVLEFALCAIEQHKRDILEAFIGIIGLHIAHFKYTRELITCAIAHKSFACLRLLLELGAPPYTADGTHVVIKAVRYNILSDVMPMFFKGNVTEKDLISTLSTEVNKLCPVRVTLLGAPAAGKTTLVNIISQYTKNSSVEFPTGNLATDGIEISPIGSLEFWDFGGQETLFTTHQFFLAEEVQYIIVTDCSALMNTTQNRRDATIRETRNCMSMVRKFTLDRTAAPVILVVTHCDAVSAKEKQNGIAFLTKLSQEVKLHIYPTIFEISNSKAVRKQVGSLIDVLHAQATEYILSLRGLTPQSIQNFNIAHTLLRMNIELNRGQLNLPFVWWRDFLEMCHTVGISTPDDVNRATRFLVNFGTIITYRHSSTGACSLVILDPQWLSRAFTSIVSIKFQTSRMKRGYLSREALESNWQELSIPRAIWGQLTQLFEMFHMMVCLPSGEYFVPSLMYTASLSNLNNSPEFLAAEKQFRQFMNTENVHSYSREFTLSDIPVGFIERLVVRLLHFPHIEYLGGTLNKFFLTRRGVMIMLQRTDQNGVFITILTQDVSIGLSFLCNFIFESPGAILNSSALGTNIEKVKVFYHNNALGEEYDLLSRSLISIENPEQCPDLYLFEVPRLDSSTCVLTSRLAEGSFGVVWKGQLYEGHNEDIVVKELKNTTVAKRKEFIREVLMMSLLKSLFLVKLHGICSVSPSMQASSANIITASGHNAMDAASTVMVLEFAPLGDLTRCNQELKQKSDLLKTKLALDVAQGLCTIHKSTLPLIHRDVRSQNVFVFSLDESTVLQNNSVHAKLGDFGTVVVASPTYGEQLGNWQYMAPEAFRGALSVPYSPQIDVYSFGILLWEIFTGEPPYKEFLKDPIFGQNQILSGVRPDTSNLPPMIASVMKKCWRPDPAARPNFQKISKRLHTLLTTKFLSAAKGQ